MRYIFVAGYIHDQLTISILFTAVNCDNWQKPLKVTKRHLHGSRPSKVIQGRRICHQSKGHNILVVNSNFKGISHCFGATATYWSKSRLWDIPLFHLKFSLGWQLANVSMKLIPPKLDTMCYRQ